MIIFELLVLVVIAIFVANGAKAGAIETLGRLVGAVLGFLAARAWAGWFITALALFMPLTWASLLAFLIVFSTVAGIVGAVFKLAESILKIFEKLPIIKQISSILGMVFGFLEAIVTLGGIAFLLRQVAGPLGAADTIVNLTLVKWIEGVFTLLLAFLL